jgi:hypothetical protein
MCEFNLRVARATNFGTNAKQCLDLLITFVSNFLFVSFVNSCNAHVNSKISVVIK